ncbi:MAG: histidinol-phosphate transaminase [Bacteroidaceae bacterium]|nr:histidinol-phosphate transaminase [Bacteroidaceae bacterium]
MKDLKDLLRPNIAVLSPYTSARDEYKGKEAHVFLDANENPFNQPLNRYPDPEQAELKLKLQAIKGVAPQSIFFGNGSDECIDLMFRMFCRPGIDNAVAIEPTYGMYGVTAAINDVEYRRVLLDDDFQPDADKLLAAIDSNTKLVFFCSPNNPSGNDIDHSVIDRVLDSFDGIVVIDEAYIDFTEMPSYTTKLSQYPGLVVLQTFSKAWGMAGIRLGLAFASPEIISVMNSVKYPYNVNVLTQRKALEEVEQAERVEVWVRDIVAERKRIMPIVAAMPFCQRVFKSDANFFLARFDDARALYDYLSECGIIVRNRSKIALCGNTLRITIGTRQENDELIDCMSRFK